jgi:hypothetical protein
MHVEYKPGMIIHVCPTCMKKTQDNFIWFCTSCGKTYSRPKESVISRLEDSGFENAASLRDGMQLIMGIDMCIDCNPLGIVEYVCKEEADGIAINA